MSFSNKNMRQPVKGKPHIVKIGGLWRVSPLRMPPFSFLSNRDKWDDAHVWCSIRNSKLIRNALMANREKERNERKAAKKSTTGN